MTDTTRRLLILDIDGVVVHPGSTTTRSTESWTAALERDLGIDPAKLVKHFFLPDAGRSTSLMDACSTGEMAVESALYGLMDKLGYSGDVETILSYWFSRDSYVDRSLLALVARLREGFGVKCHLATSQEHRRAAYLWDDIGLRDHFDGMFYSARLGISKKTPAFYDAVTNMLGLDAASAVYFDDRSEFVSIATSAGWSASLYESPSSISNHAIVGEWLTGLVHPVPI